MREYRLSSIPVKINISSHYVGLQKLIFDWIYHACVWFESGLFAPHIKIVISICSSKYGWAL